MEYLKSLRITEADAHAIVRELIDAYGDDVWNYIFLMVKNKEAADDLSQEVFLAVFQSLHRFEGRSSPKTWILAIARNASVNWLKSAFVKRVVLGGIVRTGGSHRSAEQEALSRMGIRAIWRSVMKLPVKLREVLVLDAHHQLTYAEIAETLGVSEGTVKSRLHRARSKMDAMLQEEGERE